MPIIEKKKVRINISLTLPKTINQLRHVFSVLLQKRKIDNRQRKVINFHFFLLLF